MSTVAAISSLVRFDEVRCRAIAALLGQMAIPPMQEEFTVSELNSVDRANYLLCTVAICHQTQDLRGIVEGTFLRGWDYLAATLASAVRNSQLRLDPDSLAALRDDELSSMVACDVHGATLSEIGERAALLRDVGSVMKKNSWTSLGDVYRDSAGRAVTGDQSFASLLRLFQAFQDPVEKKSLYLLGLVQACLQWAFQDADHISAPVDYHEVRGHLRLGTVVVDEPVLQRRLMDKEPVSIEEDIVIRMATRRAIESISRFCDSRPLVLHYLFWNLFRNICVREIPYCDSVPGSVEVPKRYRELLPVSDGHLHCPFTRTCKAKETGEFIREHANPGTSWY